MGKNISQSACQHEKLNLKRVENDSKKNNGNMAEKNRKQLFANVPMDIIGFIQKNN